MNTINNDMLPALKMRDKREELKEIMMAILFGIILVMWVNIVFTIFGANA